MCYNCGCQMPDNPMGKGHAGAEPTGKNITNKTFAASADAMGETERESKENSLDLLKKVLGEKPYKIVKSGKFDKYLDL